MSNLENFNLENYDISCSISAAYTAKDNPLLEDIVNLSTQDVDLKQGQGPLKLHIILTYSPACTKM